MNNTNDNKTNASEQSKPNLKWVKGFDEDGQLHTVGVVSGNFVKIIGKFNNSDDANITCAQCAKTNRRA